MTTFNKKAFKGLPTAIRVRKPRYYYRDIIETYNEDTTKEVFLRKFEGLETEVSLGAIEFEEKKLWNDVTFKKGVKVLAPYVEGVNYLTTVKGLAYNVVGSVENHENLVSSFASSSYLEIPVINLKNANTWETKFKFTTGSAVTNGYCVFQSCIGSGTNDRYGMVQIIESSKMQFYVSFDGTSWTNCANFDVAVNTTYYMKASFDGEKYVLEYSLDDVDYTKAGEYVTTDKISYDLNKSIIGNYYADGSWFNYWQGSIDLNESYIKVNGVDVWGKNGNCLFTGEGCLDGISDSSEEKEYTAFVKDDVVLLKENDVDIDGYIWANKVIVPKHDVFKKYIKDYTTVGNILLNSDYSASGFSASNYILSPSVITEPENNTYLFVTRVTTGDDSSSRNIFWTNSSSDYGCGTASSNRWRFWRGSAYYGGSFEYNTSYWVAVMQYPDQTILYYMKDDGTYKDISELPLPAIRGGTQPYWSVGPTYNGIVYGIDVIRIGNGYASTNEYWEGNIDLANTAIYKNYNNTMATAEVIWKPLKDVV